MARTVAQVDARLTTEITTRAGQLAGTSGSVLLDRINALEARVKKLESPPPPVIEPLPPQVVSGPVAFGYDGQTIQNIIIDIAPSKPMTLDLQLGPIDPATGKRMGTNPTYSVYAKGRADCKARNVTVRGRNFGFLLIDLINFDADYCTVLDADYCAFAAFGGNGAIHHATVQRIGMLRTDMKDPGKSNNAYAFKGDQASLAGGSSGWPTGWTFEDGVIEDIPLWQGLNSHGGRNYLFQRNVIRRVPRAVFVTTSDGVRILENRLLDPITDIPRGGTDDVTAVSFGGIVGGSIDGNTISSKFTSGVKNIDPYVSRPSSGVVIGTNPIV